MVCLKQSYSEICFNMQNSLVKKAVAERDNGMRTIIELAGAKAQVDCRYQENIDFFRDYICEGPAAIKICPTEEDLRRMEARQREQDARDGTPDMAHPDWFSERLAIHSLLAEELLKERVLLVHGSAIVLDGDAYVFMADSGTGKSTHTRLWREYFGDRAWMINDDKPMLKLAKNGAVVFGTPWDGKHHLSRNASAPLRAIVKLTRSEKNYVEPLGNADALSVILQHCIHSESPAGMRLVLQMASELIGQAGFYRLGCNMELDAARIAWQGITGRTESL